MTFRKPSIDDGRAIWGLAKASGTLDLNSPYAYLMACRNFADTCVVAGEGEEPCGFVLAYRPPVTPDAVFVWQVGVRQERRGEGIGGRMLAELLERPSCRDVQYLEATVTGSNQPSQRLFRGFARRLGVECAEEPCFPETAFPDAHEEEVLLRIGPLQAS